MTLNLLAQQFISTVLRKYSGMLVNILQITSLWLFHHNKNSNLFQPLKYHKLKENDGIYIKSNANDLTWGGGHNLFDPINQYHLNKDKYVHINKILCMFLYVL